MAKYNITYKDFKKVLEADLKSLYDMSMEADLFDQMVGKYLDPTIVPDSQILDALKDACADCMAKPDLVEYIQLNAFLGALKKINTKKLKRKK